MVIREVLLFLLFTFKVNIKYRIQLEIVEYEFFKDFSFDNSKVFFHCIFITVYKIGNSMFNYICPEILVELKKNRNLQSCESCFTK